MLLSLTVLWYMTSRWQLCLPVFSIDESCHGTVVRASVWLCACLSLSPSSSFIVLLPFSCSASAKTEAVRIGWELNCSARARSQLSSPWDNEMTINEKAVAIRSFVHLQVERQCVETDRKHCSRGRHWKVPSGCFHNKAAVKNSCDYHKTKV